MHLLRIPLRAEGDAGGDAAKAAAGNADPAKGGAADPAKTTDEAAALRAKLAEFEAKEAKRAAAEKKAADDAAKARGDYEKLLAEREEALKVHAEKLKAFEEREAARVAKLDKANAERVKALPESARALVPAGMDADATAEWLDKAAKVFDAEQIASGARRSTTTGEAIPPECQAQFDRYGKHLGGTVQDWFQNVWKPSQPQKTATGGMRN